jgi:cardiolipin synthase
MISVPNLLTLMRFALVPVIGLQIVAGRYVLAFALFCVSALSDLADGYIARRWNMRTRFGALADPLADKLTMLSVAVLLTLQNWLPWWFTLALAARDALIVGGVAAYRLLIAPVEMAPSLLSKLNTGLEFLTLLGTLAIRARLLPDGAWARWLVAATLGTIVLSGAQYLVIGARMALRERARRTATARSS